MEVVTGMDLMNLMILQMMFDYGFRTYSYEPSEREIVSLKGKNLSEGNMLFIRNKERVLERIKTALKINVHGASIQKYNVCVLILWYKKI